MAAPVGGRGLFVLPPVHLFVLAFSKQFQATTGLGMTVETDTPSILRRNSGGDEADVASAGEGRLLQSMGLTVASNRSTMVIRHDGQMAECNLLPVKKMTAGLAWSGGERC